MAAEVQRVGKNYYIQTPNYWFPIEPHFVFPFFQFLPKSVRIHLLMNFNLGNFRKFEYKNQAANIVDEIKLLSSKELKLLFPSSKLYREKIFGLTKSMTAYYNNTKNKEI